MAAAGHREHVRPRPELRRPCRRTVVQGAQRTAGVHQVAGHLHRPPPGQLASGQRRLHALRVRTGGGDRQAGAQRPPRGRPRLPGRLHGVQRLRDPRLPGELLPAQPAGEEPRRHHPGGAVDRRRGRGSRAEPAGPAHLGQRRVAPGRQHRGHDLRHSLPDRILLQLHDPAAGRHDRHRHPGRPVRRGPGDEVVVEVEGVGRLVNRIVSEAEFFRARAQEHAE